MTELQLGLLAIGALVVVGVLVYNAVQERGARRRFAREFRKHADAMPGGRAPSVPRASAAGERRMTHSAAGDAVDLPDDKFDYVIEIEVEKPAPGKTLFERMPSIQRRFANGVRVAVADAQGVWHRPTAEVGGFVRVRTGLQLVTRAGVASEAELIEFRSEIENLAAELHATISAADLRGALENARALDRLCEDADIQIALHVSPAPGAAFDPDVVAAEAAAAGLITAGERYEFRDGDGQVLFALERAGRTAGEGAQPASLTLLLDVPRVKDARRVYESMVRTARQLSTVLGGSLADENGAVLDERALVAIGTEIERIVAALGGHGIATGSLLARRLFA